MAEQAKIPEYLGKCEIVHIHDDGDLTIKCRDKKYVVTTEGEVFKETKGGKDMKVTEECFRTVDVWLDITRDFAILKGLIYAGKEYKDMDNVFGNLILTEDYGFSKEILSEEDRKISKYHRDRVKGLLGNKFGASRAAEEAITWAGRTFADKVVDCECGKKE